MKLLRGHGSILAGESEGRSALGAGRWWGSRSESLSRLAPIAQRPLLRRLFFVGEVFQEILSDSAGHEDLLQVIERDDRERNSGGGERGADGREREMARFFSRREFGVLPVEDTA